ncbi:MAG TPA: GNAT family protein [Gaiellaceae bacterium]
MHLKLEPPDPPLSDGVVTLRIPDPERDAPSLRLFDDPEIIEYILGGPPSPLDAAEAFAEQLRWWNEGTNAMFSIDAAGHDERVGFSRVMLGLVNPFGFAEIGYVLFAPGRGRGYASRTVRLLATWIFDDLGIGRIQARTRADNIASQRVLERTGFHREGLARGGHVLPVSGERIDTVMWSLLPGELR